jgi:hypothetical protein
MKIYTGGGDRGKTSLFSGERVNKSDLRVEAYGDVDELNSPGLHYQDFFRRTARLYVPCLSASPDQAGAIENGFGGRVTQYLKEYFPSSTYDFYLCGRQEMIRDVTLLVDEKFSGSLVYTETFF